MCDSRRPVVSRLRSIGWSKTVPTGISEAPKALHEGFDAGSFKTKEENGKGNLQLSFAHPSDDGTVLVDADIDIYTDVLRHTFGEVFVNYLTDTKTDPFRVYNILTEFEHPTRLSAEGERR